MAYDEERERPSWREIDRRRDRGGGRGRARAETEVERALKSRWVKERYLKEVEKLFAGKKGTREHERALSRVHKSYGTSRFQKAVRDYVREYGMPDDWGTLILLLDHRDADLVCEAMRLLKDKFPEKGPVERQGFVSKLRILSMTAKDDRVREEAMGVLDELGH